MKDQRAIDIGAQDRAVVHVDLTDRADAIVRDQEAAVRHARIGRVMRIAADPAGHDGAAREILEHVARHLDRAGAKADAARMRLVVVSDPQCDLPEVSEYITGRTRRARLPRPAPPPASATSRSDALRTRGSPIGNSSSASRGRFG